MLTLMACSLQNDTRFTISVFSSCIPKQCTRAELANNGQGLISKIKRNFANAISASLMSSINYRERAANCKALKINSKNAYLHTRGHDIYNLIAYMGRLICRGQNVNFEHDVMLRNMSSIEWEMNAIENDLKSF